MSAPTDRAEPALPSHSSRPGADRRRPANVVLIGLSGSGKSTVARLLARRLGWRALDTDREIRRRTGRSIQEIFREDGEPAFREIEAEIVQSACGGAHQVIATGGGAVLDPTSRRSMRDGNLVVLLEARPETLAARLTDSVRQEPRPLLAAPNLAARLAELARERAPVYECAHEVVSTEGRLPRDVAEAIADLVRARR